MGFFSISKLILSSLFHKSATAAYPAAPMKTHPLVRGQIDIVIEECIFCGICARKCPPGAIAVSKGEKTWAIRRFDCIVCNSCVENCPKKCLSMRASLPPVGDAQTKDVVTVARVSADL